MSKLTLSTRLGQQYNAANIAELLRQVETQTNLLSEGRLAGRYAAQTAAPTTGSWARGDIVDNSEPSVVSDDQADYVIVGWICTASGTPGTWKERRVLVEGITVPTLTSAATQAEQETATSTTTYVSPGRQHFNPSAAKGWIKANVDGTVDASYNVNSIVDGGTGNVTVNWETDFSSIHHCDVATPMSTTAALACRINNELGASTNVLSYDMAANLADPEHFMIVAFGDQ